MPRTGNDAVQWAKNVGSWTPSGMCQQFTRSAFAVNSYYGSAAAAWNGAKHKHRVDRGSQVPRGVPVFWTGGSRGYGHAAVSLGNGLVRSTDWPSRYNVGTARIDDITRNWGLNLVGWTEDINTVRVYTPQPKLPAIDASDVARAARNRQKVSRGALLKRAVAKEVGKGNMNLRSSLLGGEFREQYKKVQKEYLSKSGQRFNPQDVDGIPGRASLEWLGKRHGFTVR